MVRLPFPPPAGPPGSLEARQAAAYQRLTAILDGQDEKLKQIVNLAFGLLTDGKDLRVELEQWRLMRDE